MAVAIKTRIYFKPGFALLAPYEKYVVLSPARMGTRGAMRAP